MSSATTLSNYGRRTLLMSEMFPKEIRRAALPTYLSATARRRIPSRKRYFKYLSGRGWPGSSFSQHVERIHHRAPSLINWKLLTPRVKGCSPLA